MLKSADSVVLLANIIRHMETKKANKLRLKFPIIFISTNERPPRSALALHWVFTSTVLFKKIIMHIHFSHTKDPGEAGYTTATTTTHPASSIGADCMGPEECA